MIKKIAPPTPSLPLPRRKPTEVWTIPVHPPDPNTRVTTPPVGKIIRTTVLLCVLCGIAGAATVTKAPQGAMPADPARTLIARATAPFICGIGAGGVYVDTTCAQVCVCNPAVPAWCRSDTGFCNTPTDCC